MIRANGVDLHVQRLAPKGPHAGDGRTSDGAPPPTVVFIHGVFIDSLASYYFTLGPAFSAAGCDAVMYDLRGHGRSQRPAGGYAMEDFAADLDALLDQLGIAHPVHLVGNSFGGTVALDYAVHRQERVASVTVIESGPATRRWAAAMTSAMQEAADREDALSWFTAQYGTVATTQETDQRRDAHLNRLGKAAGRLMETTTIAADLTAGRVLTDDQLASLRRPVLLVYGSEGLVAAEAPRLEALLPYCRSAVVPGQKHSVLIEAPATVRELTLQWVREHTQDPSREEAPAR